LEDILDDDMTEGMAEYTAKCQTYEGGLAPFPYAEAHAGYTFCGLAALAILGKIDAINVTSLLEWLVNKQCELEGGFCGRTNKLVDTCYNFWNGACFSVLNKYHKDKDGNFQFNYDNSLLFDQEMLQKYTLWACQNTETGGFVDKPGKNIDYYHTNYSMMGLNLSFSCDVNDLDGSEKEVFTFWGDSDKNQLNKIDPVYGLCNKRMFNMKSYFEYQEKI